MKTLTRILCLGLVLALSLPCTPALSKDQETAKSKSSSTKSSSSSKKSTSGSKKSTSTSSSSKKSKTSKGKDAPAKKSSSPKGTPPVSGGAGFRGHAWGSSLKELGEPELREEADGMKYYVVPGEFGDVLGVPMREIVYVYCGDRLIGGLTRYDGQVNHLLLQAKMGDAYGSPTESAPNSVGDRSWRFATDDSIMIMEYSSKGTTGAVAWRAAESSKFCQ